MPTGTMSAERASAAKRLVVILATTARTNVACGNRGHLSILSDIFGVPAVVAEVFPDAKMERWTERMDGIFTDEDRANKGIVMVQCVGCRQWQKRELQVAAPCEHCGGTAFDPTSTTSLRTFNPLNAKGRKPKGYKK